MQVEYNLKEQCKYCLQYFKRVNGHYPHCSSYYSPDMDIIKDIKNKRQSKKKNNIRDSSFDMNKIVKGFLPELMSSEKNNIIDENYVYFPNLFLGEGCYGAVVFGAKLDDYTSIGIKVQKKTNIKDELKIEYNILKILPGTSPLPKVFYHEMNNEGNLLIESL